MGSFFGERSGVIFVVNACATDILKYCKGSACLWFIFTKMSVARSIMTASDQSNMKCKSYVYWTVHHLSS